MTNHVTEADPASWEAQTPCAECGGRPGVNPATGVELRQGHYLGCSQWTDTP